MPELYDLNEMLREIEDDEKVEFAKNRKMTQNEIERMVTEKKEEQKAVHAKQ